MGKLHVSTPVKFLPAVQRSARALCSSTALIAALLAVCGAYAEPEAAQPEAEKWTTSLGLYVSAKEAHAMLQSDKSVVLIDARPRPAYYYLGHPQNAYSIPARFWTGELNPDTGTFTFRGNSRFAEDVATMIPNKEAKILILASTGTSGATAVERLAVGGYRNVYNITDGFDGWRKSELPVILKVNAKRVFIRAN
jgi:rhodanese-related sulfurtransferase